MSVQHDFEAKVFRLSLDTGEEAVLCYTILVDGTLDLYHTQVPSSQRGRGKGAVLAEAALSYAKSHNLKVKLTCTYLQHYLTKHPQYKDLVV